MSKLDYVDQSAIRRYRLERVRNLSAIEDVAAVLLFDPVNIRYANGSRNMQVWTMHNFCRYTLLATAGPSVMFDGTTGHHLLEGLETFDEIRPAWSSDYMISGYTLCLYHFLVFFVLSIWDLKRACTTTFIQALLRNYTGFKLR